jgi:hypothetical protein
MDQKFHGDDEKTWESRFWNLVQWLTAIIWPKSRNSNIRHDGILSIGNFMLMINNHFTRFQLPGNLLKTKKCAPYFRGNTQFPIYWNLTSWGYLPYKFRLRRVKPWVLLRKYHRRTNPMTFLATILGSKNQTKYSDFWNLTNPLQIPTKKG